MVPDYVSALGNFCGDIGPVVHIAADHKKRGMNVVSGENIEQMEGVRVVRPVVEGQRDLLRTSLAAAESPPKPLAGWGKRLISGGGQGNSGGRGERKHARIVSKGRSKKSEVRIEPWFYFCILPSDFCILRC